MFTHTAWRHTDPSLSSRRPVRTTRQDRAYSIYRTRRSARVGETETEAKKKGRKVRVGRFELRQNGKAREIGETEGFVKVVTDARSGRIIGAAVLSSEGAELVHLFVDVMNAGGRAATIRDAIHVHPTLAEAVQSAVAAIE